LIELDQRLTRRALLRALAGGAAAVGILPLLAACGDDDDDAAGAEADPQADPPAEADPEAEGTQALDPDATLVVYSGRSEELVGPIIERFEERAGIRVDVRYGDTAELAAQLLEEGGNSPAHVFFAQDAGALGAVAGEGMFAQLDDELLNRVEARFRSPDGLWVGVSGRARAVVYNTDALTEADIPASILDFTDEKWQGKLGWAPTNGSFQAFVTALRVERGDDVARDWLEGIKANDTRVYEGNNPIVEAVVNGELEAGFVNHYYLLRQEAEAGADLPASNHIYRNGDPGALVNVAGVGLLQSAADDDEAHEVAEAFIEYLLATEAQEYFAAETYEYPLVEGVQGAEGLVPLADIQTPDIDLSDLADLEGTLELLRDVGLL
jgi:iron(III) transport system substrate-binding protein